MSDEQGLPVRRPAQFSLLALMIITVLLSGLVWCGVTIWQQREENRALKKEIAEHELEKAMMRYAIDKFRSGIMTPDMKGEK